MSQTVREVLASVFAPDVVERVYDAALRMAHAPAVPEEAHRTREFVEGPLRLAVQQAGGEEAADAVMDGLNPILEMAGSHVRAKRRPHASPPSTMPAPPPDPQTETTPEQTLVLMATLDRTGIEGVARCLVGRASVRQVSDVFDLVSAMEANAARSPLLVIDCCLPAIDPATVATMLPVLPEGSRVVLWGATDRMRSELEGLAPSAQDWLPCAADATHEDVASLLSSLI